MSKKGENVQKRETKSKQVHKVKRRNGKSKRKRQRSKNWKIRKTKFKMKKKSKRGIDKVQKLKKR